MLTTFIRKALIIAPSTLVKALVAVLVVYTTDLAIADNIINSANNETQSLSTKVTKASWHHYVRYARSFQALNGTIYLLGPLKTTDGGKTLTLTDNSDPELGSSINGFQISTLFSRKGLFIGLGYQAVCSADSRCVAKMWRSFDDLKTIEKGETIVFLPEAGKVENDDGNGWTGIFFHRRVVQMPDGSLLACMQGNFEQDKITPTDPRSKAEVKYKMRTFVVRSTDQGKTWRYLSTVAAPSADMVDDTEGFDEGSLQLLDDGRLLAIMRTGNYTPMVASWSSDGGKTWSEPVTPKGLGPGVDPYLLKLSDGRLALAYGQTVQRTGPKKEDYRQKDQRRRCQLAINADGMGESWVTTTVADYSERSAYPTIFEVEPNVIVYQSGLELWRVELPPAQAKKQ